MAWSGGKNAAHALEVLQTSTDFRVEGLVVWVDPSGRVHGNQVPSALIEEQARSVGLPLLIVPDESEVMTTSAARPSGSALRSLGERGVAQLAFGDGQGSDSIERHRDLAEGAGLKPVFPLIDPSPDQLAHSMLEAGLRAVLTAVDRTKAPRAWVGRTFSSDLLDERTPEIHPTGGAGEFHTFVCGGSVLRMPVSPRWVDLEHVDSWVLARLAPGPRRGYGRG